MPVNKFKHFEDLDRFEREGKGISWRFMPDSEFRHRALKFEIRVPFPPGVYKFKTHDEAEDWERNWWIKIGITKRTR